MKCRAGMVGLVLTVLTAAASFCRAEAIYVSPSGDDANSGTQAAPLRTLTRARDRVRGLAWQKTADIDVYLEDGTYTLDETVVFTSRDSGCNGHVIHYQNASGAHPVISGGVTIGGWRLHDAGKNIWMAAVSESDNFRQMYVDGQEATRARGGPMGLKKSAGGYAASTDALAGFRNPSQMEIVCSPHEWQQERLPIVAIQGREVTLAEPCWSMVNHGKYPGYSDATRVENAYECLTEPGFWYLDRAARTLFYIPRDGEKMAGVKVEVPVTEGLVKLDGDGAGPVANLQFSGLSFRLSNWLLPSTGAGLVTSQANQMNGKLPAMSAAIECDGAQHVAIVGCEFHELGGDGINVLSGSRDVTIDRCRFSDLAGSAVQIGSGEGLKLPASSPEIVADVTVSNCTIHDVCTDYQCGCGIFAGLVRDCTLSHNELFNLPYTGISLGWGWGKPCAFSGGNKIVGNKIHDHMRVLFDGGGIYCNGTETNGLIEGNFVYAQGHRYGAIYLDDGSTGWTVRQNVVKKAGADEWYLFKGHDNHAMGNYSDDAKVFDQQPPDNAAHHFTPDTTVDTTIVKNGDWPSGAVRIMRDAGPAAAP